MRLFPWLLLILLPVFLAANGGPNFEGERLEFRLERIAEESDTLLWSVSGDFYFSNLSQEPLSRLIWFPVPSSDSIGVAEDVFVSIPETADSMSVELIRQTPQGFSFRLDLPERSFAGVRISYRQRISGSEARYVLLTTNAWGRPLPSSEIALRLEPGLELAELPFPNPAISHDGSSYHWSFLNFVPEKDFILHFRRFP